MTTPSLILGLAFCSAALAALALTLPAYGRQDARLAAIARAADETPPPTPRWRNQLAAWLRRLRVGQRQAMAAQLPLALMLIVTSLRSGLGVLQAIQFVGREGPRPLADEFARFADELGMGLGFEEALERLRVRLDSVEGDMLAASLLVQHQTGGNLAEIVANLHDAIRDRQAVIGQIRTLTAMGRMSGWILTALPVVLALAVFMLNREYLLVLATDPRGRMMAATAITLMAVGGLMIRKAIRVTL